MSCSTLTLVLVHQQWMMRTWPAWRLAQVQAAIAQQMFCQWTFPAIFTTPGISAVQLEAQRLPNLTHPSAPVGVEGAAVELDVVGQQRCSKSNSLGVNWLNWSLD